MGRSMQNLRTWKLNLINKLIFQPTMAEGGEDIDLVEDIIITPFSRQTFQEKLDRGRRRRYKACHRRERGSFATFKVPTTSAINGSQAPRSTANCTAGNAYYLQVIDLVFGATLALQT